ncbi:MAG: hypothetical protein J6M59_06005 [Bacteroidaceae bacterium]|nr:hypothetical protein [Bacteroidaceae bacterium]
MVLKVKIMNKLVICFFLLSQIAFAQKSVKVCGYYVCAFDKKEIVSFYENKLRQLEGKSFSQMVDFSKQKKILITEIDGRKIFDNERDILRSCYFECKTDTAVVFPDDPRDAEKFERGGIKLNDIIKTAFFKDNALSLSPYYECLGENKLLKYFYFEGDAYLQSTDRLRDNRSWEILADYGLYGSKYAIFVNRVNKCTPYKLIDGCKPWFPFDK